MGHEPVMIDEVVRFLVSDRSQTILDGTVGAGGHASAILESSPTVRLIGIDRDADALALAAQNLFKFRERVTLVHANYDEFGRAVSGPVDGALLDLGISSMQLAPDRGFSHAAAGPLDMRMDRSGDSDAARWIADASTESIADALRTYGEVRTRVRAIAAALRRAADAQMLNTTTDLRAIVESVLGRGATPAAMSRVFQAFRIAVNDELGALKRFLERIFNFLAVGARLVVISYHSLEDRIVKMFLREQSAECSCPPHLPICVCGLTPKVRVLTRRVVKPSAVEILRNPRSRSARLRAAEYIFTGGAA